MVLKQIGVVAFKLQLPEQARIHPVFHVSQLKKAAKHHSVEHGLPAELQDSTESYQPFQILGTRTMKQSGSEIPRALVHWQGKLPEEAT